VVTLLEPPAADEGDLSWLHRNGAVPILRFRIIQAETNPHADVSRRRGIGEYGKK